VNTTILVKFLVDVGVWICDLCLPRLSIILLLLLTLGQIWFDPLNHSLDFLIFLAQTFSSSSFARIQATSI